MRQARPWFIRSTNPGDYTWDFESVEIPSRSNGYPLQVPFSENGGMYVVHTLLLRELNYPELTPSGTYTLWFRGTGTIRLDFDAQFEEYNQSETAIPIEVRPSEEDISLTILESDPNDPIHDIRLCFLALILYWMQKHYILPL